MICVRSVFITFFLLFTLSKIMLVLSAWSSKGDFRRMLLTSSIIDVILLFSLKISLNMTAGFCAT